MVDEVGEIDLYNATIRTKNLENRANGEIYLKDQGKIESAIFTSTKDSKIYFIGSGSGFGSISGTQSITLDGEEFFQAGLLNTTEALDTATQTILSQINQVQSFKSITTYAMSNLYNRSIQAQISKPATHLAYNPYTPTLSDTQSDFSLYSQAFTQNASYNTHFFNLEERIGYRFTLTPSDTLKPYAGVGLHLYYQPSYSESGDFTYSQNSLFFWELCPPCRIRVSQSLLFL